MKPPSTPTSLPQARVISPGVTLSTFPVSSDCTINVCNPWAPPVLLTSNLWPWSQPSLCAAPPGRGCQVDEGRYWSGGSETDPEVAHGGWCQGDSNAVWILFFSFLMSNNNHLLGTTESVLWYMLRCLQLVIGLFVLKKKYSVFENIQLTLWMCCWRSWVTGFLGRSN